MTDDEFVAVLGAGVMGTGISTLLLSQGLSVVLVDIDEAPLRKARDEIALGLRHAQLMGAAAVDREPGRLTTSLALLDIGGAVAVIEAITELPELKAKVLAEASAAVRAGTPLISNTSGIPIDELAAAAARPAELIGIHFMNPSYLISMVEVIRGPRTGQETLAAVTSLLARLGRRAVVVRDAPGFVTSRLLHPMLNDAARVVGEGTASVEAVDALMQGCLGHPIGPLRTADLIGIDNLVDSLNVLHRRTADERCRPSELLLEKVQRGELGRKTGRGFYDYREAAL